MLTPGDELAHYLFASLREFSLNYVVINASFFLKNKPYIASS
jgi:hypothetical protein